MGRLTFEVPDLVVRRLEALAQASGKSIDELALEGLDSFAGSRLSRRAIGEARRTAAKQTGAPYSLADLGWLEGYTGQTVDELLLFEGSEGLHPIVFALELAIQEKIKTAGPLQMSGVELMVLSVSALNREVNNGGYHQFFMNSSRRFAPMIVNHLVLIGCTAIADITQEALDSLGVPQLTVPAIEQALSLEDEKRDRLLNRCDLAFYETTGLLEKLFTYVKAHQAGIHI